MSESFVVSATNDYLQVEVSEAEDRQKPQSIPSRIPAKVGNTVLDEVKAEIDDDDS